jgi:hypothetical protein
VSTVRQRLMSTAATSPPLLRPGRRSSRPAQSRHHGLPGDGYDGHGRYLLILPLTGEVNGCGDGDQVDHHDRHQCYGGHAPDIAFQGERLEVFPGELLVGERRTISSTGPARWPP